MSHTHTNPFFNRQRITDPTYFCGREREIEALYSAIATRQCRSIVGERKMGKSSLLTHLSCPNTLEAHNFDPNRYLFVYVDLEGMANVTYDEFWPEVLDMLEAALPPQTADLRQRVNALLDQPTIRFMQVRRLLRRIERAGLTIILMLDEFESLAANAEFDSGFYGELRSLAGEMGVVYLTASKQSLYDLTYQHADTLSSPFFNIFSEERLGLLSDAESIQLLRQLSSLHDGRSFSPTHIEQMIRLAGPHPFFLQVLGALLYNAQTKNSGESFEQITFRFRTAAEDHFRYLWEQLAPEEQSALQRPDSSPYEIRKQLKLKSLLITTNGVIEPFSQAFTEFISRTRYQKRPTKPQRTATNITGLTNATLGSYEVHHRLGRGGMAVVYKGYQASLRREVAIKVMARALAGDDEFLKRFQQEAASVANLRHQNIVQMYDFNVQDEIFYMVMEYIDGITLKDRLTELREKNQRMPLAEVAKVMHEVAAALDYAHAHSIIHRDVKPANIMLRREDRLAQLTGVIPFSAVLTDFGVARMLEGVQLTNTGVTIGTPDYMSPEQAQGHPAESASDIYALGIILYEILTGELPFTADTPIAVLLKHMQADPPSVIMKAPDLPLKLEPIIIRALAKNPENRFVTASQMAEAISQAIEAYS